MKATALVPLLLAIAVGTQVEEEEAVLTALKVCSEGITPSEDDLEEISKGELKSETAKAVIACWFKGAEVMKDKMLHKEKTVTFLRALTPGDPKNDNVPLMQKLAEKCHSLVGQPKDDASEVEAATIIYDCLVREGRAMRLTLQEGNGAANATQPS
ncbi:uncharacterized protein LOC117643767 [Thrips palmi]|uniref:Uncharacterized protein LOC117643767 n=1 Tax=Thrips palmi TaxID=161013 RepID=A0A6P8YX10_THRPL|nr:uncharacterized protein LOC117643767 [Thrips palmi]